MRLRRRHPLSEPVALAAQRLKQLESRIALLDRVRPLDMSSEVTRLTAALCAGKRLVPRFRYALAPDLTDVRSALGRFDAAVGLEGQLLAQRAEELELEARLAEAVATPEFRVLAGRRFPLPQNAKSLRLQALEWLPVPAPPLRELHITDDRGDPLSLWSCLTERLERARLPVRVEIVPGLVSLAAVADGVVRVRAGARLSAEVAQRIALHEVEGHVRPRWAAQRLGGVWLAGSARSSEDEEGRALWLEQRAGLLLPARRAELALRYLGAASVREGADFEETVALLSEQGATPPSAIELACRVHRGGGLGRELVYLSGLSRVGRAFAIRPQLEWAMSHGRVAVEAAAGLLDTGSVQLYDDGDVV